jgi:hypothetical protein
MKKVLYAAAVVLLGAGLAVAQSEYDPSTDQQTGSMSGTQSADTQMPASTSPQPSVENPPGAMSGDVGSSKSVDTPAPGSEAPTPDGADNSMSSDQSSTGAMQESTTTTEKNTTTTTTTTPSAAPDTSGSIPDK